MNEESKKIEQAEQKPNADKKPQAELTAEDLEQVAGGVSPMDDESPKETVTF